MVSDQKRVRGRRVTVKDLARDLGMSVSTVSRAFYPDAVIAAETRKTVLERAAEIGYRPNPFAQSLITKKTQIAGMVVSDLTNPFYPELMTRLTTLLRQAGINLMLAAADQPEKIDEAVDLLLTYQPDLMIVLATNLNSHAREKCEAAGAPVIFFNLVMGLIQSVQAFTQVYLVSEGTGEPAGWSLVLSLHLFLSAFQDLDMGYASAMAWILFVVLLGTTAALFRSARHWVHYQGIR